MMAYKEVKAFLEALIANPEAQKLLSAMPEPETDEDRFRAWAEIAKELGYTVSEADLKACFAEREKALRESAEAAESTIVELSEEEMDRVAGGGAHADCKDTFLDKENCWASDGCDTVFHGYSTYICKSVGRCSERAFTTIYCDAFMP